MRRLSAVLHQYHLYLHGHLRQLPLFYDYPEIRRRRGRRIFRRRRRIRHFSVLDRRRRRRIVQLVIESPILSLNGGKFRPRIRDRRTPAVIHAVKKNPDRSGRGFIAVRQFLATRSHYLPHPTVLGHARRSLGFAVRHPRGGDYGGLTTGFRFGSRNSRGLEEVRLERSRCRKTQVSGEWPRFAEFLENVSVPRATSHGFARSRQEGSDLQSDLEGCGLGQFVSPSEGLLVHHGFLSPDFPERGFVLPWRGVTAARLPA